MYAVVAKCTQTELGKKGEKGGENRARKCKDYTFLVGSSSMAALAS